VVTVLADDDEPPPPVATRPRVQHKKPPPVATPATPPPSEVSLVEAARAALAARDRAGALVATARHEALYPGGVLVEEREAIAIEALAGQGKTAAASERLARFVERFPRSSYRRHLEQIAPP
jgi:hypothetical protein